MRRIVILAVTIVALAVIQFFLNCSNPLDIAAKQGLTPQEPVTEVDTVTVTDTVTQVDTVLIVEPGPGESLTVCTILRANLREIIWTFQNEEGDFLLEFDASPEREFVMYTILLDIDGHKFEWDPAESSTFTRELYLSQGATIRLGPDQPNLLGHQVDICLAVTRK